MARWKAGPDLQGPGRLPGYDRGTTGVRPGYGRGTAEVGSGYEWGRNKVKMVTNVCFIKWTSDVCNQEKKKKKKSWIGTSKCSLYLYSPSIVIVPNDLSTVHVLMLLGWVMPDCAALSDVFLMAVSIQILYGNIKYYFLVSKIFYLTCLNIVESFGLFQLCKVWASRLNLAAKGFIQKFVLKASLTWEQALVERLTVLGDSCKPQTNRRTQQGCLTTKDLNH